MDSQLTPVQLVAVWLLPLLFAITLHEVAHGLVASWFGDQTAKLSGRLTINPIKHIDIIGTIVVPILMLISGGFIFGWAKPVPVNSRNVSNPRWQMPIISLAGPVSNFLMALFWAGIEKLGYVLATTNPWFSTPMILMGEAGIAINVMLGILNCLPVPPLDGWHALLYGVSGRVSYRLAKWEYIGFFVLVFLLISGALTYLIAPPTFALIALIKSWFQILPTPNMLR